MRWPSWWRRRKPQIDIPKIKSEAFEQGVKKGLKRGEEDGHKKGFKTGWNEALTEIQKTTVEIKKR